MHQFHRIENIDNKWYNDFLSIYSISFPLHEQRNHEQQLYAFGNKHYRLFCQNNENRLDAFLAFWDFEEYVYIEHFAVNDKIRGKSIGTNTLRQFKKEIKKTIVLEIDPVIDEITAKRLDFYQKLDFKLCPFKHIHPAYHKKYEPHELLVLSSDSILSPAMYETFRNDLNKIVMGCLSTANLE